MPGPTGEPRTRPTSPSSAPAPPGSMRRSAPRAQGASVVLVSATPLAQTASYWAQGGLAAALADDDSPELHLRDTERGGARAGAPLGGRDPRRARRRTASRDLQSLGVRFDADRFGRSRSGSRAGTRSAASCMPAAARPGAASCASSRRSPPPSRASTVLEGARARALWRAGGRCRRGRVRLRRWCSRAAACCSPRAARRRCGRARPTRPARRAIGLAARPRGGRRASRPRAAAVPSRPR